MPVDLLVELFLKRETLWRELLDLVGMEDHLTPEEEARGCELRQILVGDCYRPTKKSPNQELRKRFAYLTDGWALRRGWCLSGPGPARFGWYLESVAGSRKYLGPTARTVLDQLSTSGRA